MKKLMLTFIALLSFISVNVSSQTVGTRQEELEKFRKYQNIVFAAAGLADTIEREQRGLANNTDKNEIQLIRQYDGIKNNLLSANKSLIVLMNVAALGALVEPKNSTMKKVVALHIEEICKNMLRVNPANNAVKQIKDEQKKLTIDLLRLMKSSAEMMKVSEDAIETTASLNKTIYTECQRLSNSRNW